MDKITSVVGIIFKISSSKQEDKIIHLLNEKGEKISLLAKGVKKHTSKRSQSLELGNIVNIKFVNGYNIPLLTDVKTLDESLEWKKDFKSIIYLQLICEILNFFTLENNEEPLLYKLTYSTLKSIPTNPEYLVGIFSLKLLDITGHLPELNQDINTNQEINSTNAILSNDGIGYVMDKSEGGYSVDNERIYKTQRFVLGNSVEKCLKVKLNDSETKRFLNIHLNWIESVVDRKIKSRDVINSINQ